MVTESPPTSGILSDRQRDLHYQMEGEAQRHGAQRHQVAPMHALPQATEGFATSPGLLGPPELEGQEGSSPETLRGASPTNTLISDLCLQNFESSFWALVRAAPGH